MKKVVANNQRTKYMIVLQNRTEYILIEIYTVNWALLLSTPRGLMARIPGFHPGGPGSIPGVGEILFAFYGTSSKLVLLLFTTYCFQSKLRNSQNF